MNLKKAAIFTSSSRAKATKLNFCKKVLAAETGVEISTKSGAMFGLDARIALAIFGALSVISGAALYSAIQQSKTVSLLADLNEFGKAFEEYRLTTGELLGFAGSNSSDSVAYNMILSINLINNTLNRKGWVGPYINYPQYGSSPADFLKYPKGRELYYVIADFDGVMGAANPWHNAICNFGEPCGLWICINYFEDLDLLKKLDSFIDNGDGDSSGSVRWSNSTIANTKHLYYRYSTIKSRY